MTARSFRFRNGEGNSGQPTNMKLAKGSKLLSAGIRPSFQVKPTGGRDLGALLSRHQQFGQSLRFPVNAEMPGCYLCDSGMLETKYIIMHT